VAYDWVSLLTDYGTADGFVAACRGAIARIAPAVRVIDITHEVPPGDIRRGAVVLAQTVPALPPAVHVGVVDPGVGTARRAIALRTPGGVLVGPDNGLLGWAAEALGGITAAVTLTDPAYHLPSAASTFDGRDVFAPVAAHLAAGADFAAVGTPLDPRDLVLLPEPRRRAVPGRLDCEVLTVDRFGNVQTSGRTDDVAVAGLAQGDDVLVGTPSGRHRMPFAGAFGEVAAGAPLCFLDSAGRLAIAVNGGDAAARLGVAASDPLTISAVGPS
jgi:hypothetical protein